MKKTTNTKGSSNPKPPLAKGFGFGEAMFNVNSLTSEYAQFNDPPVVVNKNPVNVPAQKKATTVVPNKPINNPPKVVTVQQKQ